LVFVSVAAFDIVTCAIDNTFFNTLQSSVDHRYVRWCSAQRLPSLQRRCTSRDSGLRTQNCKLETRPNRTLLGSESRVNCTRKLHGEGGLFISVKRSIRFCRCV
jgi:hypothetical protein